MPFSSPTLRSAWPKRRTVSMSAGMPGRRRLGTNTSSPRSFFTRRPLGSVNPAYHSPGLCPAAPPAAICRAQGVGR